MKLYGSLLNNQYNNGKQCRVFSWLLWIRGPSWIVAIFHFHPILCDLIDSCEKWCPCILYFENLECERKWKTWLDPRSFYNMMGLKGQKLTSNSDVPLEMFRLVNISAMIQFPDSCWEGHRLLWCPWFRALWQWGRGEPLGWEVGCRRWRQSQETKGIGWPFHYSLLCWFIKEDMTWHMYTV